MICKQVKSTLLKMKAPLSRRNIPGILLQHCIDQCLHSFNNKCAPAALSDKSPVQYKTELGFYAIVDAVSAFPCLLHLAGIMILCYFRWGADDVFQRSTSAGTKPRAGAVSVFASI